ncbi:MAG: SMP-30/gluconolactonase/LRE family protein [Acidimicrobiia bacterium]|nr:SMP-30/gluconolactonase/LRE family protein [Acidimicrobiia bacterium]
MAMETSLVWLDWETASVSRFLDVEDVEQGNRFNDGRCDSAGRYVVGTMHPDDVARRFEGSLYSIDARGNVDILETDVGIPNSTVFDAARGRMYWADTFHATIWQWDYDIETGRRSNKSVFFDYNAHPDAHGVPDGACLDIDGCVWSASVHGWALTRITPDGDIDRVVDLPVAMPTMPAFGGPDLGTIYVTSINGGQIDETRSAGIPAGALLAVDAGVQGLLEPHFAA